MAGPTLPASSSASYAALQRAEVAGAHLPPLLIAAKRIAATVMQGMHGRRRRGPGDTFWQYRHYQPGDPTTRIDWRQSAKTSSIFIREHEWIAAQSVWLWRDCSPSMAYSAAKNLSEKGERAELLTLALASLLMRSGEHVGLSGDGRPPRSGRAALTQMAETLARNATSAANGEDAPSVPPIEPLPRYGHIVLFSDFLGPMEEIAGIIGAYGARGVIGHLVQILDPSEETLPFTGRVRFEGMENEGSTLINRTETVRNDYQNRLIARREQLIALGHRHGWSFTLHHTDRPATEALLALYNAMTLSRDQW
ncbi:MAG: DUF58 domain-containing protein [Alphaproteobacteria bacterium]|jgi:uncharacterized protein (DUF58 family)